jgi:peptidoglycan/LPS O-acetylase OafA/YrhL
MFAGTVVYRAQHGQIRRGAAVASLSVVTLSVIVAHRINGVAPRTWVVTVAAVAGTFLLAYGLRQRDVPIVWTWLGQISYSLYLLHAVILLVLSRLVPGLGTQPPVIRLVVGLLYLTAALTAAWFSYRMVELPGQALGRRLTARGVPAARVATQRAASGTGRGENARRCV